MFKKIVLIVLGCLAGTLIINVPLASSFKPVTPQFKWENFVGWEKQSKSEPIVIYKIHNSNKPCNNSGIGNKVDIKYQIHTDELKGKKALEWLRSQGLMKINSTGNYKWTKFYKDWKNRKHNKKDLYWQYCASSQKSQNYCGSKVPKEEREKLCFKKEIKKGKIKIVPKNWNVRGFGKDARDFCNQIAGWDWTNLHYEGNVEIWKTIVDCYVGCIKKYESGEITSSDCLGCRRGCKKDNPYMKCE